MLMQTLGLGYGDANAVALRAKDASAPAAHDANPLVAIYAGAKAPLRALHEHLCQQIDALGADEKAPEKTVRIGSAADIDAERMDWVRAAYDAQVDADAGADSVQTQRVLAHKQRIAGQRRVVKVHLVEREADGVEEGAVAQERHLVFVQAAAQGVKKREICGDWLGG